MQRNCDGRLVRGESIGSDLESGAGCSLAKALNESVCCALIALADGDIQNQLRVPLNRHEGVVVAKVLIVFGSHAFLLLADEGPQLIALHVANFHVAYLLSHDAFALLARPATSEWSCDGH